MFADACEKAMRFTRPVIISSRTVDGKTHSGCAAFIVLNRDGWIMTAGHVFQQMIKYQEDQKKIKDIDEIISSEGPHPNLRKDPSWITNHSFWWGQDNLAFTDGFIDLELDIAIGRLEGFRPEMISEYPVFKDPANIRPGTSLCRIGFPFIESTTDFDEEQKRFCIRQGVLPMVFFPNDGIHTRNVYMGKSRNGEYDRLYIETSTPGMRGQSGGPIFDRNGCVAAMQVRTAHLPLGFAPTIINNKGESIVENQFLNVGLGLHVKTIMKLLDDKGIKYNRESDDQGFRIVG
ncbi:MAG: trypsin-like peptidase domain-containing protein [Candidatus Methanomethylophilaceae archaeon]|nr:trypsin-like peptidase domain-containing protein [Candidatus Methanomethylophilaceae archaeon]